MSDDARVFFAALTDALNGEAVERLLDEILTEGTRLGMHGVLWVQSRRTNH